MKTKALVVLSGGQDSVTCLYWAKREYTEVHAVTFDYGQRHRREIDMAAKIAGMAGVDHTLITVPQNMLRSASPLNNPNVPLETYTDFKSMEATIGDRVELTFVPMRNALFLTLAANLAIAKGIRNLVTGVCQEDNANYPDCRATFVAAQEETINQALGIKDFQIQTPLLFLTKSDTVKLAAELGQDCLDAVSYSHTCYAGEYPPCGVCHSCVLRAHGFEEAGMKDPLVERAVREGRMPSPYPA